MGEGLVVGLNGLRVVQVADHKPVRFLDPARRDVAEPIDAFEPGAVVKVTPKNYRFKAALSARPYNSTLLVPGCAAAVHGINALLGSRSRAVIQGELKNSPAWHIVARAKQAAVSLDDGATDR